MEILKYVGLVLFAVPFVLSGISHLLTTGPLTEYALYKGVPAAKFSVIVTGIILVVAPFLVIFGVIPQIALAALALFLIATAVKMHNFWAVDPEQRQVEQVNFNKNIGLAGAALALIALI
jgi:uncharacterized membrane protein YphA (DoxX/SURF4 family)